MLKDLRHGMRMLLQAKGWTVVVVLSLALGIGANTALFSAVNGLLLKQVPVKDPDTLVRLRGVGRNQMATSSSDYGYSAPDAGGLDVRSTFSFPMYQQFVADNRTMTDLFACAPIGRVNFVLDGQAEIATAFVATGNYRPLGEAVAARRPGAADAARLARPDVRAAAHGRDGHRVRHRARAPGDAHQSEGSAEREQPERGGLTNPAEQVAAGLQVTT